MSLDFLHWRIDQIIVCIILLVTLAILSMMFYLVKFTQKFLFLRVTSIFAIFVSVCALFLRFILVYQFSFFYALHIYLMCVLWIYIYVTPPLHAITIIVIFWFILILFYSDFVDPPELVVGSLIFLMSLWYPPIHLPDYPWFHPMEF